MKRLRLHQSSTCIWCKHALRKILNRKEVVSKRSGHGSARFLLAESVWILFHLRDSTAPHTTSCSTLQEYAGQKCLHNTETRCHHPDNNWCCRNVRLLFSEAGFYRIALHVGQILPASVRYYQESVLLLSGKPIFISGILSSIFST